MRVLGTLMRRIVLPGLLLAQALLPFQAHASESETGSPCELRPEIAHSRPGAGGVPLDVEVGVVVVNVVDIDDVAQSFLADLLFIARWTEPRLSAAVLGRSLSGCRIAPEDVWLPDLRALNLHSLLRTVGPSISVSPQGEVTWSRQDLVALSSPMDLRQFPFDRQELRLRVASFSYGPGDIRFVAWDDLEERRGLSWIPTGWRLMDEATDIDVAPVQMGARQFVRLDHVLVVQRESAYYLWNLALPMCFIALMAWSVFWLDPKDTSAQIGIATASTITLIAFLISLRARLPPVGYLTRLDFVTLGATVLVFSAFGQAVLTSRLAQSQRLALARRIDLGGRWLYLAVAAAGLIAFVFL